MAVKQKDAGRWSVDIERFGAGDGRRVEACYAIYRTTREAEDPGTPVMPPGVFRGWLVMGMRAGDFMRDGVLMGRDRDHLFLRSFGSLANRFRHFVRLAKPDTNLSVMIACHDQRTEAETASAFHHLGAAIDENHFLGGIASCGRRFVGAAIESSSWVR